jgi:hypothetical protein
VASWDDLERAEPKMAAMGRKLLAKLGLAFLATTRRDGSPRVNPVCPVIADGRLFVATAPDSPKRLDLLRDGRYVLHMLPGEQDAEFSVRGRARRVTDPATRALVVAEAARTPFPDGTFLNIRDEEWLFEYDVDEAMTAYWENVGTSDIRAVRRRWRAS